MSKIQFYGIRHHGPGSALRLRSALEDWEPDLILIELPADGQNLLDAFDPSDMQPPVAILFYDPQKFTNAAYFPFAPFSPEWEALLYGYYHLVPCKAIDIPMSTYLPTEDNIEKGTRNPFEILASYSGFEDVEQWWDHFLENNQSSENLFNSIESLMNALRDHWPISRENQWREDYMRREIQKYSHHGYERIAVVCGAFHLPALREYSKAHKTQVPKTKSGKSEAIWIPWSYERLTQANAYGAGVHHPTWYEALHSHGRDAGQKWMARAISLLRDKGQNTSSAHSVEALKLAEALRKIRKKNRIGIPELEEALTAVVFDGQPDWVKIYGPDLFIGKTTGHIRDEMLLIPIQQDFRLRIKKARLTRILENRSPIQRTLDLRKDLHRSHSRFFYQTRILHIPLAHLDDPNQNALGTFRESWELEWDPIAEWTIVQAGTYGTTIESAARSRILKSVQDAEEMNILVEALKDSFLCGFEDVFESIQHQMIRIYAVSDSVVSLLQSLEMLLHVDQFGHIRWEKTPKLGPLIERIAERSVQMLPAVILQLDEEMDQAIRRTLKQVLYTLLNPAYRSIRAIFSDSWIQILTQTNRTDFYHGLALKQAMDQNLIDHHDAEQQMNQHFSDPDPLRILDWLEGLLSGHILWIAYDDHFLRLINRWIGGMDQATFRHHLPVLRKIFTQGGETERRKLMGHIRYPHTGELSADSEHIPAEVEKYIRELIEVYLH